LAFCRGFSRSLPPFAFDDFDDDFGLASLDSFASLASLASLETEVEGGFVTAIGVPEFGAVGEVSVVEEVAEEPVLLLALEGTVEEPLPTEVFKFSVVVGPVEEPVPVELFELI